MTFALRTAFAMSLAALSLGACASKPPSIFYDADRNTPQKITPRPAVPGYGAAVAKQDIPWSIDSLVADFIELNFESEGGYTYNQLLRWPSGVRIGYVGPELAAYRADVLSLIDQLNAAAPGLDAQLAPAESSQIILRTAPKQEMLDVADTALCFFVPVDMDWDTFKVADARGEANWSDVDDFENITIFIPAFAAPDTFRICFVEEIMQALGPGNDLYRLEDSGFNDDEVHKAPTAFDLLMLRILYDDEMRPGMTRSEARSAARRIIGKVLPRDPAATKRLKRRPRWNFDKEFQRYHYAAGAIDDPSDQKAVIDYTLTLSRKFDEDDHRIGEALRNAAYYESNHGSPRRAIELAFEAVQHFENTLDLSSPRLARTRSDFGYFLMLEERFDEALPQLAAAEAPLAANAMDAEYASTLRLKALALAGAGRGPEARETARRALEWAAYVFGADADGLSRWRNEFKDFDIIV